MSNEDFPVRYDSYPISRGNQSSKKINNVEPAIRSFRNESTLPVIFQLKATEFKDLIISSGQGFFMSDIIFPLENFYANRLELFSLYKNFSQIVFIEKSTGKFFPSHDIYIGIFPYQSVNWIGHLR